MQLEDYSYTKAKILGDRKATAKRYLTIAASTAGVAAVGMLASGAGAVWLGALGCFVSYHLTRRD